MDYFDPQALVQSMANPQKRFSAYQDLIKIGEPALPALRAGLKSEIHQVRKWSAMCLDQVSDEAALDDLIPLLDDPSSQVRLWAVHSIACEHCKEDVSCMTDLVPLLIKRAMEDSSLRVRRMAVIMLSTEFEDARALPVLRDILKNESDRKLRLHAARGLNQLVNKVLNQKKESSIFR